MPHVRTRLERSNPTIFDNAAKLSKLPTPLLRYLCVNLDVQLGSADQ